MVGSDSLMEPLNNGGVYIITCIPTSKIYIGSTYDFYKRWKSHKSELKSGTHGNSYLQNAWAKYGEASFTFSILQPVVNISNLFVIEEQWIRIKDATNRDIGYNIAQVCGPNHFLGKKHSEESKAKMSASLKGKLVGEHNGAFGKKRPQETRDRISAKNKGRKFTPEQKERLREAKKHIDQSAKSSRMWEARRLKGNITQTPESRQKAWETRRSRYGDDNQLRRPIAAFDESGNKVMEFVSARAACRAGYTTASRSARLGKKAAGFYWKYLDQLN